MIVLGIDPGLATMGWGVLNSERGRYETVDYGVVLTPKDETLPVRLAMLEEGVNKLVAKYKPEEIALEELFFNNNITTGINVAQARGVILIYSVADKTSFDRIRESRQKANANYGKNAFKTRHHS